MSLADQLKERREKILDRMFELSDKTVPTPPDEIRQFLAGFFHLVQSSAEGDDQPRNDYLETVIPGIKAAGMPLPLVMDGMVRVAMVLAAEVDTEHVPWMVEFNAKYTTRLLEIWTQP